MFKPNSVRDDRWAEVSSPKRLMLHLVDALSTILFTYTENSIGELHLAVLQLGVAQGSKCSRSLLSVDGDGTENFPGT